jgi:hypothetical protein
VREEGADAFYSGYEGGGGGYVDGFRGGGGGVRGWDGGVEDGSFGDCYVWRGKSDAVLEEGKGEGRTVW